MATNTIKTRIKSKYDTLAHWIASASNENGHQPFIPLAGELCVAVIPTTTENDYTVGNPDSSGLSPYAIGVKVGDGIHSFIDLPWIQAIAGDVYAWAKASSKPSYTATEIAMDTFDTPSGTSNVQNIISSLNSRINTISGELDTLSGGAEGVGSISTQITSALEGLDVNSMTGLNAGQTLLSLTEANGLINATFQDISISKSQIYDQTFGTAASANVATSSITANDASSDLTTKAQVANFVATATAGLTGAMHFKGTTFIRNN